MQSLIFFWGGGVELGLSCDTQKPQQHWYFIFFLFIWNIPKHVNYEISWLFIDCVNTTDFIFHVSLTLKVNVNKHIVS